MRKIIHRFWAILFIFSLAIIIGYTNATISSPESNTTSKLERPKQTNDGWETTSLQEADIDSAMILKVLGKIHSNTYENIHSLLIVKNGYLAFEKYFPGYAFKYDASRFRGKLTDYDANTLHNMASVTKSITGLLVGISLDQGIINDVNDKVIDYLPGYNSMIDSTLYRITLHHLLNMTSGLEWNEQDVFYSEVENDIIQLFMVSDPMSYILSKPVIHEPGRYWYYNGGGTNMLGEIIHIASGETLVEFCKEFLFSPLGIADYEWEYINPDIVYASGNIKLRPRDMAKLGHLVLKDGVWNDQQIVSSEWIQNMVKTQWTFSDTQGYGYHWWLRIFQLGSFSIESYYASGWGGQFIYVFPSLEAIVVLTGGNYDRRSPDIEILFRYLLPAMIPDYNVQLKGNDEIEFARIQKEAPITENISLVEPSIDVKSNIKALSGQWFGRWDYSTASQLVVENINIKKAKADIIYSFSGYNTLRKKADIIASGQIKFMIGDAELTYELDASDDTLIGYYRMGQSVSKIVMKRRN